MDSQEKLQSELQAEFTRTIIELGFDPSTCPIPTLADFERVLDSHLRHKMAGACVTPDGGD